MCALSSRLTMEREREATLHPTRRRRRRRRRQRRRTNAHNARACVCACVFTEEERERETRAHFKVAETPDEIKHTRDQKRVITMPQKIYYYYYSRGSLRRPAAVGIPIEECTWTRRETVSLACHVSSLSPKNTYVSHEKTNVFSRRQQPLLKP